MVYLSILILLIGIALLLKYKMAKTPSSIDAKVGFFLLPISFVIGLIGNLSGDGVHDETRQLESLERAKIIIPASEWIQKHGIKGAVAVILSKNDQGQSLPLQVSCLEELRKQFPSLDLKVSELDYQSPITEAQLNAACAKSEAVILLCALPQEQSKLKEIFLLEDQPKFKAHFLVLNSNSNTVRDFFTSHGSSFTILQPKQASTQGLPAQASQKDLFDLFYETINGRTEAPVEAKTEE
ncbi:MAG: hypothetical protein RL095_1313 [Verrucomicrobiota bacterium]|jgi:hypothetical protein